MADDLLDPSDVEVPSYIPGITCPKCEDTRVYEAVGVVRSDYTVIYECTKTECGQTATFTFTS